MIWSSLLAHELQGIAAEPLPAKVDHLNRWYSSTPQNTSGKFTLRFHSRSRCRKVFHRSSVDAPIFGGHLLKIGEDFSALLDLFKRACEDAGYDLQYNDPKIDFRLFNHDRRTRFLYIKIVQTRRKLSTAPLNLAALAPNK